MADVLLVRKGCGITKAEAKRIEKATGGVVVFVDSFDDVRRADAELAPMERVLLESALLAIDRAGAIGSDTRREFHANVTRYARNAAGQLPWKEG